MQSAEKQNGRRHSESTKAKIAKGNTGKVFSEERCQNIGKAREVKLSEEKLKLLEQWWSKGYYTKTWIMKKMDLSERVYDRLAKKICNTEQPKFLPQNLEPWVFEYIITKTKENIPSMDVAGQLGLGIKQVRGIIAKLASLYNIKPIPRPRYKPVGEHKEKLREKLITYNKQNPKKKEQNPNWKGGITALSDLIRVMPKYKEWRMTVLKRDDFKCINCAAKGYLHVDHVYPFYLLLEDGKVTSIEEAENYAPLWNTANGRTMCEICHRKTETYGKQRAKNRD